jgi:hypothetical protein
MSAPSLSRHVFTTSRLAEFSSKKELVNQTVTPSDLGTRARIGCHTFRATGITAYLEAWRHVGERTGHAHESPRTTKLYDHTCADLGITPETRPDHAAFIASWLKVLKDDKRAIFTAASHAQKAADYARLAVASPSSRRSRREGCASALPDRSQTTSIPARNCDNMLS